MKRRFIILSVVVAAAGTLLAAAVYFSGAESAQPQARLAASLEGFEPGSNVDYKIIMPQGAAITGQGTVGSAGTFEIPGAQMSVAPSLFDFSIEEAGNEDPVNLVLTFKNDEVSMLGDGFDNFAALSYKDGAADINTKADWAGIVRRKAQLDTRKEFQIAFAGNNLADAIGPNPKIVKVFRAPGGGGPGPAGVNRYSNLWCSFAGVVPIPSTCRPYHMNAVHGSIVDIFDTAMLMMTEQLTAVMMKSVAVIGTLFDAKQQLETQRQMNLLTAEAHKDYHPSEQMCQFGSFIKSIPEAEMKADFNKQAMNSVLMGTYTNLKDRSTSEGNALDTKARLAQFRTTYCNPADNNNGLSYMCEHDQNGDLAGNIGAPDAKRSRMNKDIDFLRTADFPLTLNVDFTDNVKTDDEEDILALARNLYWPHAFETATSMMPNERSRMEGYMDVRAMAAVQNIAHNSFIEIAAMKSRSDAGLGAQSGWNFMKSLMREFGLSDAEIHKHLGDYPSYYAQMEVLTKKIYQSPDFYTNLYDKPANVKRIMASMEAIQVMQQRDTLESRLRQEMMTSLMLEQGLKPEAEKLDAMLSTGVKTAQ